MSSGFLPKLNTQVREVIEFTRVLAKFGTAWHYAWDGRDVGAHSTAAVALVGTSVARAAAERYGPDERLRPPQLLMS